MRTHHALCSSACRFMFHFACLALLVPLCLFSGALAQSSSTPPSEGLGDTTSTPVAGVPHDYITGLNEIVNPANGSVSVRIPQPYPHERNPNWPIYAFTYDSNLQVTKTPNWLPAIIDNQPTMIVNTLTYQYQAPQYFTGSTLTACIGSPGSCTNYECTVYSNFMQVDPDGGRHALGLQQSVNTLGGSSACSFFNVVAGQMLQGGDEHYKATLAPGGNGGVTVWDTHGNIPVSNPSGNNCVYKSALPALQEDVNGNYCNTTGRQSALPVADVTQTEQLAFPSNLTFPVTIVPNSSGGSACSFSAITLPTNAPTLPVVKSVTLPNQEQYQFTYDPTYQLLNSITYPTGATVTYTWSIIPNSEGAQYQPQFGGYAGVVCALQYGWFAITKRVVSVNGANTQEQDFQYNTTWPTTPSYKWVSKTTTVVTKDLVRNTQFETIYTYSPMLPPQSTFPAWVDLGYMPVENTVQYLDTNNNPLKTVTKNWNSINQLQAECETLPNGQTSGKYYKGYQGYAPSGWSSYPEGNATNLPTDVAEYDYGSVTVSGGACQFSGTPTREAKTTYQPFTPTSGSLITAWPSLLDRPATVQVYGVVSGTQTLMAETDYAYDGGPALQCVTSPYGHDETHFGCTSPAVPRGNATTVTKKCISGCTAPSVTNYAYDTTGQMVSSTDANGNTTRYTFTPDCYTSDDGSPPGSYTTNAYICTITRPPTNGVNHITTFTYGYEDGRLRTVKDENGQVTGLVTTYCYWTGGCSGSSFDPFVRLTGVQYPSPYNVGVNTFTYHDTGTTPSVAATKAITSSLSMTSTTTYDALGRPIETALTSDPDGTTYTATVYDGMGKAYQVYNPTRCSTPTSNCGETTWGVSTTTYDSLGRTTNITEPDGSAVNTAYNSNCTTVVDETGKLRVSCADSLGRLTQVLEPGPGATASTTGSGTVTISGSEQTETGTPGSGTATLSDNLACVWQGQNGSGQWVPTSGTVWITVHGVQTTTSFGGSCTNGPNGQGGAFTMSPTLSQIAATLASGITSSGAGVTANINPNGSIQITADTTGSNTNYAVSSGYSSAISGYEVSASVPASLTGGSGTGTTTDSGTVSVTVNGFNANATYGSGSTASQIASALGTALNAGSPVQAQVNGTVITITAIDPGSSSNYSLNTSVTWKDNDFIDPSFTATPSGSTLTGGTDGSVGNTPLLTVYTYDALNNMLTAQQQGGTTNTSLWRNRSFAYDSLSRITTAQNPESGTATYSYDPDGNLTSRVVPKEGQTGSLTTTHLYTYDALNRLTAESHQNPYEGSELYSYDGTTLTGCTGPNPPIIHSPTGLIGRMSAMCAGRSSSSWSYDSMGRPLVDARSNQGSSVTTYNVLYNYNLDGSLYQLTYPSSYVVTYTPGGAGRPLGVSDSTNDYVANGTGATRATYAPSGALTGMVNGYSSQFAGIVTSNSFTSRGQPAVLSASAPPTGTFMSLVYDFHLGKGDNGNVFQVIDNYDTTRSRAYSYDLLNRLQQANTLNTSGPNCWGEIYTIDAWANLYNVSGVPGMGTCTTESLAATATTQNQLSGLGMTYDAAGNVTQDNLGNKPTYDAENRISTVAGNTYYYDADGVRIEKAAGSTGTMYWTGPGGVTLTETDLTGAINEEYVFFGGKRMVRVDRPSGTPNYYFFDYLRSTSKIVRISGSSATLAEQYYYYPYGGAQSQVGSDPNHYKFTGKERDSESSLDNFGARYYGFTMGRFMTPDWAARPTSVPYAEFGDPQSLNLYGYVRNDPVSRVDRNGHCYFGNCDDGGHFDGPGSLIGEASAEAYSSSTGAGTIPDGAVSQEYLDLVASSTPSKSCGVVCKFFQRVNNGVHRRGFKTNDQLLPEGTVTTSHVEWVPGEHEPNGWVTAATDVAGIAISFVGGKTGKALGFADSAVSVTNDRRTMNVILNVVPLLFEDTALPLAVVGSEVDALDAVQDHLQEGMINAIPGKTMDDGYGHTVPNPSMMEDCQIFGACQ